MSAPAVLGLRTRLSKLRTMSAREITTRARYKLTLVGERRRHARTSRVDPDRLRKALRADLRGDDWRGRLLASRRASPGRFFAGVDQRDRMRELFATVYVAEREATLREASLARAHRFEFFGREFAYGADIDWHADPVSQRRWPVCYHADVPVNVGEVGFGDVKHVWELSRQQYLIDLAKAHFLTGSRDDLAAMTRLVASWIDANPYAIGVNWACALEPAFRAWSWLWSYYLTADALDPDFHVSWLAALHDHGRFLAAHLEHYWSPYNHLIGEASALLALGVCFPEFRDAESWRRSAMAVLNDRLDEQFYADGGSVEQSPFYHHATLGFYILALLIGRANGYEVGPRITAAIERGLEFSAQLIQPDGRTPAIGGADDGKPIRMEHLPFWDFRPYQAIGAVLFDRPDFKAVAGRFHEDALWLLGDEGRATFDAMPATLPERTTILLPASGYVVARSNWSADADYLCFDVGEQAAGMRRDEIPNAMHGHADALSIIVWLRGRPVFVDSGLYAYNCGGDWERHFRETAAHNTARIDRRDQAHHIAKMAWSHSYRTALEQWSGESEVWAIGSHDGYARGPNGVTHRRTVWQRHSYVLICDQFVGSGRHDLEVNYQFAPGTLALTDGRRALFDGIVDVVWIGPLPWSASAASGGERPDDGWICPSLGVRVPAPRLTLQAEMNAGIATLLTVAAARPTQAPRVSVVEAGGEHIVGIQDGDAIDWIVARGAAEHHAIETDGTIGLCRMSSKGPVEQRHAGGTHVRVDTGALGRLLESMCLEAR